MNALTKTILFFKMLIRTLNCEKYLILFYTMYEFFSVTRLREFTKIIKHKAENEPDISNDTGRITRGISSPLQQCSIVFEGNYFNIYSLF